MQFIQQIIPKLPVRISICKPQHTLPLVLGRRVIDAKKVSKHLVLGVKSVRKVAVVENEIVFKLIAYLISYHATVSFYTVAQTKRKNIFIAIEI